VEVLRICGTIFAFCDLLVLVMIEKFTVTVTPYFVQIAKLCGAVNSSPHLHNSPFPPLTGLFV
jgi:hypothetical protein